MSMMDELTDGDKAMLIEGAVAWWEQNRPNSWTLEQHLADPTVYCNTDADRVLAEAAATVVRQRQAAGGAL